ncbi:MAG: pyridoxal phosphate-dependent aminotransferase [Cryomorphaceae bacterium]
MTDVKTLYPNRKISQLAEELQGSEIIKLAGEIKTQIAEGKEIYNYTIGDFDPAIFPIPTLLKEEIIRAYENGHTNYPTSNGIIELRETLSGYIKNKLGISYSPDAFLVAGGARPLIYAAYQALLDPDEDAVFPVPSWNNNHYTTLTRGRLVAVETTAEQNFMPTAGDLAPHIESAGIIALCSPLNPTGTTFGKTKLSEICEMVVAENKRRGEGAKPLYLIYDQIYWQLCHENHQHFHPVQLNPEMRPYTIYIDGLSKAFAATGVRVGWAFGPGEVIGKMKSILGHIGAWAPKPEQVAAANYLADDRSTEIYLDDIKRKLHDRLDGFYRLFLSMKEKGLPVDVIAPQAAIYLTVQVNLKGKTAPDGNKLQSVKDVTRYILEVAGVALVPFSAFGASENSNWYRLSVGTSKMSDIDAVGEKLAAAIKRLQ